MAKLSPVFNDAQLDGNGDPIVGGRLFTWLVGSFTKRTVFTNAAESASHTNPIVLNSRGEPPSPIYLPVGVTLRFGLAPANDLSDPPTVLIRDIDDVQGVNDLGVTTISEWQASGLTPTFISATSFTVPGDQTTLLHAGLSGRRIRTQNSGGTVFSTIVSSVFTTLTTVTVSNDGIGVLDAGISSLFVGIISGVNTSAPSQRTLENKAVNPYFQYFHRALTIGPGVTGVNRIGSVHRQNSVGVTYRADRVVNALDAFPVSVIPFTPINHLEMVFVNVAGAANFFRYEHLLEDIRNWSRKDITVTMILWAAAPQNVTLSASQNFGTGGAPSADVVINGTKFAITTTPTAYSIVLALPSIAGLVLGTTEFTSTLLLKLWTNAGTDFNGETNTLGQVSGTVRIGALQVEEGKIFTGFRSFDPGEEVMRVHRYIVWTNQFAGTAFARDGYFPQQMRVGPTNVQTILSAGAGATYAASKPFAARNNTPANSMGFTQTVVNSVDATADTLWSAEF